MVLYSEQTNERGRRAAIRILFENHTEKAGMCV